MAFRKKGFTAKQSRRTSAHVSNNMIGTHVRPSVNAQRGGKHMNASSVSFSSQRKSNRAVRGEVDAFVPRTSTRESLNAHKQRVSQRKYMQQIQHRSRMRSIALAAVVVLAIVGVAIGAGYFTYTNTVGSATGLHDSDAKSALVAPKEGKAFYTLVSVELGATAESLDNDGPDVLLLARVDASSKDITFVALPSNLQVTVDGQTTQLASAAQKGDAALIKAVADFAGVSVGHYVKLSQQDLVSLVDALGGVDMDLEQEIDDPSAGDIYIPSGEQTLNGQQAVVLQRATNVSDGTDGQRVNQVKFASALLAKAFGGGSFASTLDSIGEFFQTDMSAADMTSIAGSFAGMSVDDFTSVEVPGYEKTQESLSSGSTTYYIASSSSWTQIMEDLDSGDTAAGKTSTETVDPASFTIEIQNGANITGAATTTSNLLTSKGFKVEAAGNADQQIYEQTLVIYDNDKGAEQAQTVIDALGIGRAVKGRGYYEYDTDILLILGGDYKPTS